MPVQTLQWQDDALLLLDQTRLPTEVVYVSCRDVESVARAIEELKVRGAPAIGVAAAYGVVIGARIGLESASGDFRRQVEAAIERLARTRPTAVNLFWALEQMRQVVDDNQGQDDQVSCNRPY